MNIKEFAAQVAEKIKERTPDFDVTVMDVQKNNETLTGLSIKPKGTNCGPVVYLNDLFNDFGNGCLDIENAATLVLKRIDGRIPTETPDMDFLDNWDEVKGRICAKVVSLKGNEDFLSNRIHTRVLDLAVVYGISIEIPGVPTDAGVSTICVTRDVAKRCGRGERDFFEAFLENSKGDEILEDLIDVIKRINPLFLPEDRDSAKRINLLDSDEPIVANEYGMCMYVLSNKDMSNGASIIAKENVLRAVRDRLNDDLIIIPSSVHELLIIPRSEATHSYDDLASLIAEVNDTQVAPQDRLTEHPYLFTEEGLKIA